jgi:hypothetical protein
MAEGKSQLIRESVARPIPFVENDPIPFPSLTSTYVFVGHATRPPHGGPHSKRLYECRPAGQFGAIRDCLVLKDWDRS